MTVNELSALSSSFEAQRPRLRALAYRMLGSATDADDAVQEAWLRLGRSDDRGIDNLGGWLTTVVSHVCLDMLRARRTRDTKVSPPDGQVEPSVTRIAAQPEESLALAESVSAAMLVVLDRLAPAERVAFVLHDLFDLGFEQIAPIVGRTPDAARQLASRARRRVRGDDPTVEALPEERSHQRQVVEAFLTASKTGDLQGLVALLDPEVAMRCDSAAVRLGGSPELRGAQAVAQAFKGRARAAEVVLIDGAFGLLVAPRGRLLLLLRLGFRDGKILAIEALGDPATLARAQLGVPGR